MLDGQFQVGEKVKTRDGLGEVIHRYTLSTGGEARYVVEVEGKDFIYLSSEIKEVL